MNSLELFRAFFSSKRNEDSVDNEDSGLDGNKLISTECYNQWKNVTGLVDSSNTEEQFRSCLSKHIRGSDGKKPFSQEEESAILKVVRIKRIWPCFKNAKSKSRIGVNGFRSVGFHENRLSINKPVTVSTQSMRLCTRRSSTMPRTESFSSAKSSKTKYLSSYEVFVKFAPNDKENNSRILSKECFNKWVETRRHGVKNAEHSFRKALIAHLCGKDGRRPFPEEIEPFVVAEIRKKRIWPCFIGNKDPRILNIGNKGFRHLAFHEGQLPGANKMVEKTKETKQSVQIKKSKKETLKIRKSVRRTASLVIEPLISQDESFCMKKRKISKSLSVTLPRMSSTTQLALDWNCVEDRPFERSMKRSLSGSMYTSDYRQDTHEWNTFQPIQTEFEFEVFDQFQEKKESPWDLESLDSKSFFFDSLDEHKVEEKKKLLQNFKCVTVEELEKVEKLKEMTRRIFEEYFLKVERQSGITLNFENSKDISGDVKLLRVLRTAEHSTQKSVALIEETLSWRFDQKIEEIRQQILTEDVSLDDLKSKFVLGKLGGCYPCFKQLSNGDFIDIWQQQEQTNNSADLMIKRINDHRLVFEYRSILVDRISYQRNRVVMYTTLWDCSVVQPASTQNGKHKIQWFTCVKDLHCYVDSINNLTWKYYGSTCDKVICFGKGYLYKALAGLVIKTVLSSDASSRMHIYGPPNKSKKLLKNLLEEELSWDDIIQRTATSTSLPSSKKMSVLSNSSRSL